MPATFSTALQGSGSVGADAWVDLGVIPFGQRIWFGLAKYTSPDKAITFEIRTSKTGFVASGDANTTLLYSASVTPRNGTKTFDLYNKGRLHIVSVYGTAAGERFWLRLKSKSGASGGYLYQIFHTLE